MIKINSSQLWVHDQDTALKFWTDQVGFEVRSDVTIPELDDFRWLVVGPAAQPEAAVVLMAIPGPPVIDADTADEIRQLMGKGFAGTLFLETEDCRSTVADLKRRGVEFTEEPEERPYGIDAGFRDPSGNSIRITQLRDLSAFDVAPRG